MLTIFLLLFLNMKLQKIRRENINEMTFKYEGNIAFKFKKNRIQMIQIKK